VERQVNLPGLPPASAEIRTKAGEKVDPIEEMVGALTDPIIAYPSPWMDSIPERMKKELPIHRLGHVMLCLKGKADWEEVCDLEALIYLYPASLETPLGRDWTQIYLYLATKMGEVPEDIRVETLSDPFQQEQLRELKRWIREKKLKARKERRQQEEKKTETEKREMAAERYEQLKLF